MAEFSASDMAEELLQNKQGGVQIELGDSLRLCGKWARPTVAQFRPYVRCGETT